jgi:hypothetical protein
VTWTQATTGPHLRGTTIATNSLRFSSPPALAYRRLAGRPRRRRSRANTAGPLD